MAKGHSVKDSASSIMERLASVIASTVVGLELDPKKPEEKEKSLYLNKEYKHPKGEISFSAESTPDVTRVTCRPLQCHRLAIQFYLQITNLKN